jgi:hypothetical protein
MKFTEKDIKGLFIEETFNTNYEIYKEKNKDLIKILFFLDTIKLNKEYYKLNLCNNINDVKTKNINGLLNKLTLKNITTIKDNIIENIKKDKTILNLTINSLLEKCILQNTYNDQYIEILKYIDIEFNIKKSISTIMKSYDIIFNDYIDETLIDNIYKKQYILLCEKNKRADNFIGYCEIIYKLEINNLINNEIDNIINRILDKIKSNNKDIYKYVTCLYNLLKNTSDESSYLNIIKNELLEVKDKIHDKKTNFKILDILEL